MFNKGLAAWILVCLIGPPAAHAQTTLLMADFDAKPIDAPIGTGGAAVGEPVYVSVAIEAVVRDTPLPTPCLEIADRDDYYAGHVDFEFLDDAEIYAGHLTMSCNLWFAADPSGEGYTVMFRERGSAAFNFLTLNFAGNGEVWCYDTDSHSPVLAVYETGRPVLLTVSFDMDAGTYTIWLDEVGIVWDESFGIVGSGIGSVLIGCTNDANLVGTLYVDDILVTDEAPVSAVGPRKPAPPATLAPCFPNPFNPRTTIVFEIPAPEAVSLRVFDLSGRLVKGLVTAEVRSAGRHEVVWNGRDDAGRRVASGTYVYRLDAGDFSEARRMVLAK
jgi:hypothetical protein